MIELSEFIAEAVTSIVRGIQQGQASDVGDHIAPLIQGEKRNEYGNFHLKDDPSNQATIVQFDVVTALHWAVARVLSQGSDPIVSSPRGASPKAGAGG
jgi:hypothetical protein